MMDGFTFTENILFKVPDVTEDLSLFEESTYSESHGLIVEIAALHEGTTQNFTTYEADELQKSLTTWTNPYPRPIITNHDIYSDPLGRVMGARMAKEEDGTPFMNLQAAIFNTEAAQRIADKRFLTGSVGGKATEARCSLCDSDWANPEEEICKHRRGRAYKGKRASLVFKGIEWKEYSFVNAPSDRRSSVRGAVSKEAEVPKFFVFDLHKEDVFQLTEGETNIDLFENMKKKEFQPMYLGLKGSYLSVMGVDETLQENIDNSDTPDTKNSEVDLKSQENSMPKTVSNEIDSADDDDVLAAIEALRKERQEASVEESEVDTEESDENTEDETLEESEDTTEGEQAEVEETEDVDPEEESDESSSDEEDITEDETKAEDDSVEESDADEVNEEVETEEEEEVQEQEDAEQNPEEELIETDDLVESPAGDLESRIQALEAENAALKRIVKHNLAEEVVDRKVSLGMIESNDREESVTEHASRTAASLVDSIRDLDAMKPAETDVDSHPAVEDDTIASDDDNGIFGEDEQETVEVDPVEKAEAMLTDVLMGRKAL
jgi:hypothetical protein